MKMLRTMPPTNSWKWDDDVSTTERRLMPTYYMELKVPSFLEIDIMPRCPESMVASPSWRKLFNGSCENSQKNIQPIAL